MISEVDARDELISSLQAVIQELEEHVKSIERETELKVAALLGEHRLQMTCSKEEHLTTQVENARLHAQVQELTRLNLLLRENEETLKYTVELMKEENARILEQPSVQQEVTTT